MTHAIPEDTSPTLQNYEELQRAFDHFNSELFDGQLPSCLITLQREKRSFGYFSHKRFANLMGGTTDEIAMNPCYFGVVPLVETMQTMVHEMVHLWQAHFGDVGRTRYHNRQWADKMESIGLMPSSTGRPGGKRTGDRVADYALEGGRFLQSCERLITADFRLSWFDRFPAPSHVAAGGQAESVSLSPAVGGGAPPIAASPLVASMVVTQGLTPGVQAKKPTRSKFRCSCGNNLWGKPSLAAMCMTCGSLFVSVEQTSFSATEPAGVAASDEAGGDPEKD